MPELLFTVRNVDSGSNFVSRSHRFSCLKVSETCLGQNVRQQCTIHTRKSRKLFASSLLVHKPKSQSPMPRSKSRASAFSTSGCSIFENCKRCNNGTWGPRDDFFIKGQYCAECRPGWSGGDCLSKFLTICSVHAVEPLSCFPHAMTRQTLTEGGLRVV